MKKTLLVLALLLAIALPAQAATVVSMAVQNVDPGGLHVNNHDMNKFRAWATYSDKTVRDVSTSAVWTYVTASGNTDSWLRQGWLHPATPWTSDQIEVKACYLGVCDSETYWIYF